MILSILRSFDSNFPAFLHIISLFSLEDSRSRTIQEGGSKDAVHRRNQIQMR